MRRLFWVAVGATAGVLVARKLSKVATRLQLEPAVNRVSGAFDNAVRELREFVADVRIGMAEREQELRRALGIVDEGAVSPTTEADLVEAGRHRKGF
ncbi:MAG: hypothetical protein ICV70_02035 [Jiangellaceae bacterium]|nr:hypothetical protein [Jiangellaceae bacterium]